MKENQLSCWKYPTIVICFC